MERVFAVRLVRRDSQRGETWRYRNRKRERNRKWRRDRRQQRDRNRTRNRTDAAADPRDIALDRDSDRFNQRR
jgi:hypothetical protein